MKKYKLWEVIKMMAEDKSKVFRCLDLENEFMWKDDYLLFKNGRELILNSHAMNYEWEEIQRKTITFDEALESGKRVRCEHEFIEKNDLGTNTDEEMLNKYLKAYREGKFLFITDMLFVLSWIISPDIIKEVIKEGKWYLED